MACRKLGSNEADKPEVSGYALTRHSSLKERMESIARYGEWREHPRI
jgi:hypothetical protein